MLETPIIRSIFIVTKRNHIHTTMHTYQETLRESHYGPSAASPRPEWTRRRRGYRSVCENVQRHIKYEIVTSIAKVFRHS